MSQTRTSLVLENISLVVVLPHSAGMEEVEDAYKEDKQRGLSETVSIGDKQSAERGIQEAQHAKSGEDGSDSSSSNGDGSSSKDKVSALKNGLVCWPLRRQVCVLPEKVAHAQTCLMICGCKRRLGNQLVVHDHDKKTGLSRCRKRTCSAVDISMSADCSCPAGGCTIMQSLWKEWLYSYRRIQLRRHGLDRRGPGSLAAGWRTSVFMFTPWLSCRRVSNCQMPEQQAEWPSMWHRM